MKSKIVFKDDHPQGLVSVRRFPKAAANDNFRSLEFDTEGHDRDWRLFCLVAAIVCGLGGFIFLPLW